MIKEFRKFILRGNVVDLAVGVVIGAAFNTLVQSLVSNIINPLVAVFWGGTRFTDAHFTIRHSQILYGSFLNAVISFLLVGLAVFFLVVKPINSLNERFASSKETEETTTRKCPECLSEIPNKATRCKFCSAQVEKA